MSTTKAALKAIGAALQAQKYDDAVEQAQKLLASDPQQYQANLFLGFASDKQNKFPEAEQAYERAAKSKPNDPQAHQGLIKLYEKQGAHKVDAYQHVAEKLAIIYGEQDDKYKCQDVIDKFTAFAKNQGTRMQHRKSLEIVLPTSPVYQYLEGRVPHPAFTYQTIARITEADEKERMNKEIGERRTRLGAKINQVTLEVKREIFNESPLEDVYSKIIDWSNDDDVRRQYEEKLVQRCYDALLAAPVTQQPEIRAKVEKLARDMVIIKHPYKLAWDIDIEWKDVSEIEKYDVNVLREYESFFPASGLGKVLKGYMTSEISPFPPPPPPVRYDGESDYSTDSDEDGGVMLNQVDAMAERLILMSEGLSEVSNSILAHRLIGEYYAYLEEHESVVETMRQGLKVIATDRNRTGLGFANSRQAFNAMLGTALVFYQSPKNHPEARGIFEELLQQNPRLTAALIGIGLIFEEDEDYLSAIDFLERALMRAPDNVKVQAEAAWVKALNGDYETGRQGLEACLANMDVADARIRDLRAETQYRIGICIWNLDTSKSARKDRKGAYAYFLVALKSNMNFAPAYTSLGLFYGDYTKDKKRARKCFQKAFELSPGEVVAAERLARGFAADGDWELVEAVAQRVVDSGKVKPAPGSKKAGISWPFAALGVAELNKQDYTKSVASFQAALRISPDDYHCWVGLGESYHNSGRFVAATKAFTHALTFEEKVEKKQAGDTWFAKYMLANVKRELGQYDDAIERYMQVLSPRPTEYGVRMALQQTYVESAWDSVDKGLFGQAAERANLAISEGKTLIEQGHMQAFNVWKCLGDACSVFSWVQDRLPEYDHSTVKWIYQSDDNKDAYEIFQDIDNVDLTLVHQEKPEADKLLASCVQASILAHKRSIQVSLSDPNAQAVAYYNLGWAEYRAHTSPHTSTNSTPYLKTAVRAFKRAIELEASNAEFWNALGVVTSRLSPKVAQHAFVRSLYLNERSAQVWVNYGTLALLQNDLQVSNDAFTRAQSTDPDFGLAWVGQGILALMMGDPKEAQLLFTHAIEISDSSSTLTKRQFAMSTFDYLLSSAASTKIEDLVQPIFALNQLQCMEPKEFSFQHLASLFHERVENKLSAIILLAKVTGAAEAEYEVSESPESLSRFALAKADLARSQLTIGEFETAIESGETSLSLSEADAGNDLTPEQRQKCRLSAHLTVGLAHYHNGNPAEAVNFIEAALSESVGNPDAICLLAQILWATGSQELKDKARDIVFDAIKFHPGHVQSVILLGSICLLSSDLESLAAVIDDLNSLRSSSSVTDTEQSAIGEILRASGAMTGRDPEKGTLKEIQKDVFLFPTLPAAWSRLSKVSGDENSADMTLKTALMSAPPKGVLDAEDLAKAFGGAGRAADAQRAVMCAPWEMAGWRALKAAMEAK